MSTPQTLRRLGAELVHIQPLRNAADYDPVARFSKKEVLAHVEDARGILADLQGAAPSAKRAFAVHVLFRERRD